MLSIAKTETLINDQVRFAPDNPNEVAEPQFRILSAYRTPGSILFQRTTDLRTFSRPYPNGLEIPIALGSGFAKRALRDPQKERVLKTIASCEPHFQGHSLYLQYLRALQALVDEPETRCPGFHEE